MGASLTTRYFLPRNQMLEESVTRSPRRQTSLNLQEEKDKRKFKKNVRKVVSTHFGVPLVKGKSQAS